MEETVAANPALLIGLFVLGLGAICVEMFIPGIVLGVCGAACCVTAIALAYAGKATLLGHVLLASGLGAIPVFFFLWIHVLSRFISMNKTQKATVTPKGQHELLGKQGVTITTLRPAGTARIDGKRVDVMARGQVIEPNTRIEVVAVEGNRVVVRSVEG